MSHYSGAWNETLPTDPSDADLIAADIRQLKNDLRERMNDILAVGAKWDTGIDTAIAINTTGFGSGAYTGKEQIYGTNGFVAENDEDDVFWGEGYFQSDSALGKKVRQDLLLPFGATTITRFRCWVNKAGAANMEVRLRKRQPFSLTPTTVYSTTVTATGDVLVDSGVLSETVNNENFYFLEIVGGGSGRWTAYGVILFIDGNAF